jgi:antitoxin component YwqK of YwqJK toxin-antitoxin module
MKMKKYIFFIMIAVTIASCSSCNDEKTKQKAEDPYQISENDSVFMTFKNGNPRIIRTFEFVNGKQVFLDEREYYESGQKRMEGPLQNRRREGLWKSYYEDGKIWSEGEYKDGLRDGITITYHPNGVKRFEGAFYKSKKSGIWKFWDENGEFVKEMDFENLPPENDTAQNTLPNK